MTGIDSHQHFWRYDAARYPWIDAGGALACDRLPGDVRPLMDASGIAACIAVQACHDEAETDWLLDLASANGWIVGVVGWADLTAPDLDARLAGRAGTRLVGLRHLVQDEADPRFLLRADVVAGVRTVLARGLTYDVLVRAAQWPCLPAFLDQVDGTLVLDHGGKPEIARGGRRAWADMIRAAASHRAVMCKLSGLVTEADHRHWRADDIAWYLDHLLAAFGPDRLIFGSDWPVCLLAADYPRVVDLIEAFVARACPGHRDAIFGVTAMRAYRLGEAA